MSREQALELAMVHLSRAIMQIVEENNGPWTAWSAAEAAKFIVEKGIGNP